MSISVRKSFTNVFSPKYNKRNLLVYLALLLAISLFSAFFLPQQNLGTASPKLSFDAVTIIASVCYLFFCVIATGMYDVSVNNGSRKVSGVIPDIIDSFPQIFLVGIKHCFGFFLSIIILSIISGILLIIPGIISYMMNNFFIIGFFIILSVLIVLVITSGIYLIFLKNFEFGTFFKFITAFKFICAKENVGKILIWGLKCMFFYILTLCLNYGIGFIEVLSLVNAKNTMPIEHMFMPISVIGGIVGAVFSLFILDLTIQLLQEIPKSKDE